MGDDSAEARALDLLTPLAAKRSKRHNLAAARWALATPVPRRRAHRVRLNDGMLGNETFVADLNRVLRPQRKTMDATLQPRAALAS